MSEDLVTPKRAALEAVKWLERLERAQTSSVVRRDPNVELTPVQIEQLRELTKLPLHASFVLMEGLSVPSHQLSVIHLTLNFCA